MKQSRHCGKAIRKLKNHIRRAKSYKTNGGHRMMNEKSNKATDETKCQDVKYKRDGMKMQLKRD